MLLLSIMKEWGEHKTRAEEEEEKWRDHFIDKEGDYICTVCKKVWYPTITDINQKRPSTYCKLCTACRFKSFTMRRYYKERNGNNFNALYPSKYNVV